MAENRFVTDIRKGHTTATDKAIMTISISPFRAPTIVHLLTKPAHVPLPKPIAASSSQEMVTTRIDAKHQQAESAITPSHTLRGAFWLTENKRLHSHMTAHFVTNKDMMNSTSLARKI